MDTMTAPTPGLMTPADYARMKALEGNSVESELPTDPVARAKAVLAAKKAQDDETSKMLGTTDQGPLDLPEAPSQPTAPQSKEPSAASAANKSPSPSTPAPDSTSLDTSPEDAPIVEDAPDELLENLFPSRRVTQFPGITEDVVDRLKHLKLEQAIRNRFRSDNSLRINHYPDGFVARMTELSMVLLNNEDFVRTWCSWAVSCKRPGWGARALANFIVDRALEHARMAMVYNIATPE